MMNTNMVAWANMIALGTVADLSADQIYQKLDIVKKAYEIGSVITVDHSISVFAKMYKAKPIDDQNVVGEAKLVTNEFHW